MAMVENLRTLFFDGRRPAFPVIIPFAIINIIVLINAVWHHPKIGYDSVHHLTYIQILLTRLPEEEDTIEYFSPPLPYLLPAIFDHACKSLEPEDSLGSYRGIPMSATCRFIDGKFAQAVNLVLSIGSMLLLLSIAERVWPGNQWIKTHLMILAGVTGVYYKTFAQVRGEPYVFFFFILSTFLIIKVYEEKIFNWKSTAGLGVCLGCLILSRQWGFFIFPAILTLTAWLLLKESNKYAYFAKSIGIAVLIGIVIGSWFYVSLLARYGTLTAFNMGTTSSATSEQILGLLRPTRLKDLELFRNPIRDEFSGELLPILYSETWGDYWGYFMHIKENSSYGEFGYSNEKTIGQYLGRVNAFALIPSLLFFLGVLSGMTSIGSADRQRRLTTDWFFISFCILLCLFTISGYLWFVPRYFIITDLVIKATYIIQIFMPVWFLAAYFIEKVREKNRMAYYFIYALLSIVFLHNLSSYITRYNMFYFL
jgi:hypothetical protein